MRTRESSLVAIVRDFLEAHDTLCRLAERHRAGWLRFDEVQGLVGDSEASVLFRLKERCHLLFRAADVGEGLDVAPAVLFDLAIGSLFHEAMKFRENFYQLSAYGPKVRGLRAAGVVSEDGLLREFEKILDGAAARLDEALQEAETLLAQSAGQLRALLTSEPGAGLLLRYLIERSDAVERVFGEPVDEMLKRLCGSAAEAHRLAALSYLESGFFSEAAAALRRAAERGADRREMERLSAYAEGMCAYLSRSYGEAVALLAGWLEADPSGDGLHARRLALAALGRIERLTESDAPPGLAAKAALLCARLRALDCPAATRASATG